MSLLKIGDRLFDLRKKTLIMGILNVTPDSFSDGNKYFSFDKAVKQAIRMEKEGADIIDIGGESTRPGATSISLSTEMSRIIPVLEELVQKLKIPISIDTYKSEVAKKAIDLGATMINDVSALRTDDKLAEVIAKNEVPICLMHMKGFPSDMQINPYYEDVIIEIKNFFKERVGYAVSRGIREENIILDPGIGFGKRTGKGIEDNCTILKHISDFKKLGFPVLVGASRKTFIGNICGKNKTLPVNKRLEGSLASACIAAMNGADIIRVHDVKETRRCLDIVENVIER